MTDAEFDHLAKALRAILDPDIVFVAEDGDRPAGVSVCLPDVNQALLKANPRPCLWSVPWTLAKFLWYRREIDAMRLLIMGVVQGYRNPGIDALFYPEAARAALAKGI